MTSLPDIMRKPQHSSTCFSQAILFTTLFEIIATWGIHTCKHIEKRAMLEKSLCWNVVGILATASRLTLHYVAMLLAMTYQVGIFVAICVGGGLGFLLIKYCHCECYKSDAVNDIKIAENDELFVVADRTDNPDGACC